MLLDSQSVKDMAFQEKSQPVSATILSGWHQARHVQWLPGKEMRGTNSDSEWSQELAFKLAPKGL